MKLTPLRYFMLVLFAVIAFSGTYHLALHRDLRFTIKDVDGAIIVGSVTGNAGSNNVGVLPDDRLESVGGVRVVNYWQAKWLTTRLFTKDPVPVEILRNGQNHTYGIYPKLTNHPFFVILNVLLGLVFIGVGLMVGWTSRSDTTSRAYYRLTCVAGCSLMLFGHENTLQPLFLHYLHAFAWITAHCLIPPMLLDFLSRFCGKPVVSWKRVALYAPSLLVNLITVVIFIPAYAGESPKWISAFEWILAVPFGVVMVGYFLISLSVLIHRYVPARETTDRDRSRWLLLVTAFGLVPFYVIYRLPTILGVEPLLPLWAAYAIMLIVPIGWGMAVASFKLLNVEWAFSRTIIYLMAVILAAYALLTLLLILGAPFTLLQSVPFSKQVVLVIFTLTVTAAGLAGPVRWVIDRIYYHDWFNEREAIQHLGEELSRATTEPAVVDILTVRLPLLLKVEKVTLLIGDHEELKPTPLGSPELAAEVGSAAQVIVAQGLPEISRSGQSEAGMRLSALGYEECIPLQQGGKPVGALLIGQKNSRAPFSEKDRTLLGALTAHAATALVNLSLVRRLLDQEKRALAADMAGGIAHEINNALSPLLGQAQLAERRLALQAPGETPDASFAQALDIIIKMSDRISRIAANLTRLSQPPRLETELLTLESVATESIGMLVETAGRIKRFIENDPTANFKLKREFEDGGLAILADRQQLGQLFINLIVNAADCLEEEGAGTLTIGVKRSSEGEGMIGYVADDGPGIPTELQERIFQPYFTTKPKGKGTGLGLAIVRQIAESHGGWVKLYSAPGLGTRVEFFIPRRKA